MRGIIILMLGVIGAGVGMSVYDNALFATICFFAAASIGFLIPEKVVVIVDWIVATIIAFAFVYFVILSGKHG